MKREDLTHQDLLALIEYRPETGEFFYRQDGYQGTYRAGDRAGHSDGSNGYMKMNLCGRKFRLHHIAWFYIYREWPKHEIDHMNGDRADNRIANLRDVPRFMNAQNARKKVPGTTGLLGVTPRDGRFVAQITVGYRNIYLGRFDTADAAHAAYVGAKKELHEGYVE